MADLILQRAGVGMEDAVVMEWRVADGAIVSAGDVVGTIETDKVDIDLVAPASGVIRLRAAEGESYPIGFTLAVVEEGGDGRG